MTLKMYKQKECGDLDYAKTEKEFISPVSLKELHDALRLLNRDNLPYHTGIISHSLALLNFSLLRESEAIEIKTHLNDYFELESRDEELKRKCIDKVHLVLDAIDSTLRFARYQELKTSWKAQLEMSGLAINVDDALAIRDFERQRPSAFQLYRRAGARSSADINNTNAPPSLGNILRERRVNKAAYKIGLCPALIKFSENAGV